MCKVQITKFFCINDTEGPSNSFILLLICEKIFYNLELWISISAKMKITCNIFVLEVSFISNNTDN
jgi:hypothetical protein